MTRIDRYILGQLVARFALYTLLLVALYWVNRAVVVFEQILSDGQTARVFLEVTLLSLPFIIAEVAPVAAFAASVAVAHRLVADSETVVLHAAGLSPFRLARAVAVQAVLVGALMLVLLNALVPEARAVLAERQAAIRADVAARFLREGVFQFPAAGLSVYIGRAGADGTLENLFLADHRDPAQRITYTARQALVTQTATGPKLLLIDGMVQLLDADRRLAVTRFDDFGYDLGAILTPAAIAASDPAALPTRYLLAPEADTLEATGATRAALMWRGQQRLASPVFGAAAVLIGFAALMTGGHSRLGLARQVGTGAAIMVAVFVAGNVAEGAGVRDARLVWLAWAAPLSGIGAGLALLWAAARTRRPRPLSGPGAAGTAGTAATGTAGTGTAGPGTAGAAGPAAPGTGAGA